MTKIIDKQIEQLNNDIESALRVIKDTLESRVENISKDSNCLKTIITMTSIIKTYISQISALELLKAEVQGFNKGGLK